MLQVIRWYGVVYKARGLGSWDRFSEDHDGLLLLDATRKHDQRVAVAVRLRLFIDADQRLETSAMVAFDHLIDLS